MGVGEEAGHCSPDCGRSQMGASLEPWVRSLRGFPLGGEEHDSPTVRPKTTTPIATSRRRYSRETDPSIVSCPSPSNETLQVLQQGRACLRPILTSSEGPEQTLICRSNVSKPWCLVQAGLIQAGLSSFPGHLGALESVRRPMQIVSPLEQ